MANSQFDNFGFNPDLYLNPNETDLLIAALDSNKPTQNSPSIPTDALTSVDQPLSSGGATHSGNGAGPGNISKQLPPRTSVSNTELENHPYLDFDTSEGVWDWNLGGLPENFNGADPLLSARDRKDSTDSDDEDDLDKQLSPEAGDEGEAGEKRKNSEDPSVDDGGGKRQETDTKNGKKQSQRPGRKPLTSEPTTVSSCVLT